MVTRIFIGLQVKILFKQFFIFNTLDLLISLNSQKSLCMVAGNWVVRSYQIFLLFNEIQNYCRNLKISDIADDTFHNCQFMSLLQFQIMVFLDDQKIWWLSVHKYQEKESQKTVYTRNKQLHGIKVENIHLPNCRSNFFSQICDLNLIWLDGPMKFKENLALCSQIFKVITVLAYGPTWNVFEVILLQLPDTFSFPDTGEI